NAYARTEVVEVLPDDARGKVVILDDDERQERGGKIGRHLVIRDLSADWVERSFDVVYLVPRGQIRPAQTQLQRQSVAHPPHVVDEWSECRGLVGRTRSEECSCAGRAVAQKEIRQRVRRIVRRAGGASVECETPACAGCRVLVRLPPFGLKSESQRMRSSHLARRVGQTVNPVRRVRADA